MRLGLDCFPSLRTINMYPMIFVKKERHHVLQSTTLGAPPPLILGFHPSKRHAALIASRDQDSVVLAFYFGITRTEAFLMETSTSDLDVRSMAFSRFIMLLLLIIYEYHVVFVHSRFNFILILVA